MQKRWWRRTIVSACATALMFCAQAVAQPPAPVDAGERREVVSRVAQLVETRFHDETRAAAAGQALRDRLAAGGYDRLERPEAFALAITEHLRPVLNDQHFFVRFSPPAPSSSAQTAPAAGAQSPAAAEDADAALREAYRGRNYDFREAAILDGNVGYLRLFTFAPSRMASHTAAAAMRFLANADAIILDLRGNQGGYQDLGLFLASYFFDRPTHYATRRRRGNRFEEHWTLSELPGPRLTGQDVYVLISRDTFSGGESLAYCLQALGRATIVGERTLGGATGANTLRAGERFEVNVSDVNYTSPATGSNWEGVGVRPDIAAARHETLTTAHLAALARLVKRASNPQQRTEMTWAQDLVRARADPMQINANRLQALVGDYGERSVFWESDRLLYRRSDNPIYELHAVGPDEFMIDGAVTARFRFVRDGRGRGQSLTGLFSDGSSETAERAR